MKNIKDFIRALSLLVRKDTRYKFEAYTFIMSALDFTVEKIKRPRHVTGQELLEGIREYGLQQFGPMTRAVFEHWGIMTTEDFGRIVFNMVDAGLLGKTREDSMEDFKDGYDFKEAFDKGVTFRLEK